ncbi:MAG: hypothetical protein J6334_10420 [Kiritimatiellae bacterium]|nr:hypothetical protein [Kiritimatiellia bacterium]
MKQLFAVCLSLLALSVGAAPFPSAFSLDAGRRVVCGQDARNFILSGQAFLPKGGEALLRFHTGGSGKGYEMLFRNGPIDGTRKTGSLSHIRNLYRSFAEDEAWFAFEVAVREKNIEIAINGMPVVRYTEGERPYRLERYRGMVLSRGDFVFEGVTGAVRFRDLVFTPLRDGVTNPADIYPYAEEATDPVMRLQQEDFPVINYHAHVKGGWTTKQAYDKSLVDGINYGIAVNIYGKLVRKGDGGFGRMIETDAEALDYLDGMKGWPCLHGFQGEGRKWTMSFTPKSLSRCDYIFTDSMTVVDRNRQIRLYRPDEMTYNGRDPEAWMAFYVDQIEKILTNEPADIYVNPLYLPRELAPRFEELWTEARVNRVLDLLAKYKIALEINALSRLPGHRVIRMAKARGIKFTFGTNNMDANIGRLEWALEAVAACGIRKEEMWFPSDSIRAARKAVIYNTIEE